MAKYVIEESTLKNLANAIRKVNGETKSYTPDEMIDRVTNIMDSITYILVDEDGKEVPAVYVDSETILTATPNDIRIGTVAVTDEGVTTGEKEIPAYHTTEGVEAVPAGSNFTITVRTADRYDFTKLQAIICTFNQSLAKSVAAEKVAINENVYATGSTTSLSTITVDHDNKLINLGITNTGSKPCVIRYFTYKEEN